MNFRRHNVRVLHIIETLGRGGAEQALVNLLPALNRLGVVNSVVSLWGAQTLAEQLESAGIPVHPLSLERRWSPLTGRSRLRSSIDRTRADLIVSHLYFGHLYATWAGGPPQIQVFHNQAYDQHQARTMQAQVRLSLHRAAAKRADAHVAVSRVAAVSAARHLGIPIPEVIPNAFPCDVLRPDERLDVEEVRRELGLPHDALWVICPSRLVPEKGLETLLDTLKALRHDLPNLHLLIVGDGPLRTQLNRSRHELGLDHSTTLHAAIPHAQLMTWIQAADILVLPSHFEGLGLALAEGMALEKAVIGTRETGMADLVEHGRSGMLVPRGDHEALASALRTLAESATQRRRLGVQARRRIVEAFATEAVADRWYDLFRRTLVAPPR